VAVRGSATPLALPTAADYLATTSCRGGLTANGRAHSIHDRGVSVVVEQGPKFHTNRPVLVFTSSRLKGWKSAFSTRTIGLGRVNASRHRSCS